MDEYKKILTSIKNNQLPESFNVDNNDLNVVLNLIDESLISAKIQQLYGCSFINNPRLTIRGEKELERLQNPESNQDSSNNTDHNWYQKPIGIMRISIFSGVLVIMVIYLIRKHLGILL